MQLSKQLLSCQYQSSCQKNRSLQSHSLIRFAQNITFVHQSCRRPTVIIEYSQLGHVYQCQFMLNLSSIIQIKFMHVRIYLHQVKMRKTRYYSCYSFTTSFERVVHFFILCNNLLSCFQIYMHQRMRFPSINTFCQMHETQIYYIGISVFWIAVNDKLVYKTIKMQNTKFKIKKT